MSTIRPRPRSAPTLRSERIADQKDREQQRRQSVRRDAAVPLVQVSDEEILTWPVGTAWLDTSGE